MIFYAQIFADVLVLQFIGLNVWYINLSCLISIYITAILSMDSSCYKKESDNENKPLR